MYPSSAELSDMYTSSAGLSDMYTSSAELSDMYTSTVSYQTYAHLRCVYIKSGVGGHDCSPAEEQEEGVSRTRP